MQNRYVGDIGDYVKYGLLRALSEGWRLGVAWYLYADEHHNKDGRYISYLDDASQWRACDPALFDTLAKIVSENHRNVGAVQSSNILQQATYSGELLAAPARTPHSAPRVLGYSERADWRQQWFGRVQNDLQHCDMVFADPDNGLRDDATFKAGTVKDWKSIPVREAVALAQGRPAVIYHHNSRYPGGHEKEIADWIDRLGKGTLALRWSGQSPRTFFVIRPAPGMAERIAQFANQWPKTKFYSYAAFT